MECWNQKGHLRDQFSSLTFYETSECQRIWDLPKVIINLWDQAEQAFTLRCFENWMGPRQETMSKTLSFHKERQGQEEEKDG